MIYILKKILFFTFLFILLIYSSLNSEVNEVNTTGADFLKIDSGPRETGMGGSTSSIADDIEALHVNSAGLSKLNRTQLYLEHAEWFDDINYEVIGGATPLQFIPASFAVQLKYLYITPFKSYDDWGITLNDVDYSTLQLKTGLGTRIYQNRFLLLNAGSALSLVKKRIDDFSYTKTGLDLGIQSEIKHGSPCLGKLLGKTLSLSFTVQNIDLNKDNIDETLPFLIKTGIGVSLFNQIIYCTDFIKYDDAPLGINMGMEYNIKNLISLRIGTKLGNQESFILIPGIGINYKISNYLLNFNYTVTPFSKDIGITHRIAVKIDIGKKEESPKNWDIVYCKGINYFIHNDYEKAILIWKKIPDNNPYYEKAQKRIKETEKIIEWEERQQQELKHLEQRYQETTGNKNEK